MALSVQTVDSHDITYTLLKLKQKQFWGVITSHLFLNNRLTERAKKRRTSQSIGQVMANSRQEDTGPTQVRQEASH